MCCSLIFYRKELISGAKGPNTMPRSTKDREKGLHDKRMRKEYNIGDKMVMNS